MPRAAVLAALLALAALALSTGAAKPGCEPRQEVEDPAGDTTVPQPPAGVDLGAADILHVAMERTAEGALLEVGLAGDPRATGSGPHTYSYWVGFDDGGKSSAGNVPTWTFQGSAAYDSIRTMYWDGPEDLPVTWNGTAFAFTVPWDAFTAQYGDAWPAFGSPWATSAGPSVAGLNNPGQDWARYSDRVVPLPECGAAAVGGEARAEGDGASSDEDAGGAVDGGGAGSGRGSKDAPAAPLALAIGLLAAVAVARRRT